MTPEENVEAIRKQLTSFHVPLQLQLRVDLVELEGDRVRIRWRVGNADEPSTFDNPKNVGEVRLAYDAFDFAAQNFHDESVKVAKILAEATSRDVFHDFVTTLARTPEIKPREVVESDD